MKQARTVWSIALASLLSAVGCQSRKATPAGASASAATAPIAASASVGLQAAEPPPLPPEALAKLYLGCFEAQNRGDFVALGACYADDAVGRRFQAELVESRGRDALLAAGAKGFRDAFSDARVVPQVVLVRGADVATWAVQSGTQSAALTGPTGAVDANGKAIGQLVLHTARFGKDSRIQEEWFAQDFGTTLFQLGKGKKSGRPRNTQGLVNAPIVVVASQDDAEKPGVELVRARLLALARQDFAASSAPLAESVLESDQSAADDRSGKQAVSAAEVAFWKPLSKVQLACPALWGAAQYVLARCTLRADRPASAGGPLARTWLELYELSGSTIQRITRFSTEGLPAPK